MIVLANMRDAPPVGAQPRVPLFDWRIVAIGEERHLIGFLCNGVTCRITTAVEALNHAGREARTRSKRIYEIYGPPAHDAHALAVIATRISQSLPGGSIDITDVEWAAMLAATA